jgi:hypothetical protein
MQDVQLKTLEWRARDTMIVALHVPTYVPYRQSVDDLDNPNPFYPEHHEWFNASMVLRNILSLTLGDVGGRWDGCSKRVISSQLMSNGCSGERTSKYVRFVGLSLSTTVDERRS